MMPESARERPPAANEVAGRTAIDISAATRIVFTPGEVADLLGVSKATIYRWIDAGKIPVIQLGDSRKFIPKRPLLTLFGMLGAL